MRGAESKLMSGAAVAGVMGPQQVSSRRFGGPPGHRSAGVQESMAGTTNVAAAVGLGRTPLEGLSAPAGGV